MKSASNGVQIMKRRLSALAMFALLAGGAIAEEKPRDTDAKGKACHMEQQCHWENFKKICTLVKVCR
jgi:hypothetical protein